MTKKEPLAASGALLYSIFSTVASKEMISKAATVNI